MAQHSMKDAEKTYAGFLALVKWGTILTAIVAMIVIMIIS